MENCLLIGNGINRCCEGKSWEELLKEIARNNFVSEHLVDTNTLAFEQLRFTVLSKNFKVKADDFAFSILEELNNLNQKKYNEIFAYFLELPITNILTTNFDYAIERALVPKYKYEDWTRHVVMPQETKCSRIRHTIIERRSIFHIHGELGKRGTVCLGNVHYATNLGSIMDKLLDNDRETGDYKLKEEVFGSELLSWGQFFFRDNIYIVGLGLYGCDMDLWWHIAYRQQLLLNGDKRIKNRIVYYYLYTEIDQCFKNCLEAMGIEVRECQIRDDSWKDTYINIAKNIKESMSAS